MICYRIMKHEYEKYTSYSVQKKINGTWRFVEHYDSLLKAVQRVEKAQGYKGVITQVAPNLIRKKNDIIRNTTFKLFTEHCNEICGFCGSAIPSGSNFCWECDRNFIGTLSVKSIEKAIKDK